MNTYKSENELKKEAYILLNDLITITENKKLGNKNLHAVVI